MSEHRCGDSSNNSNENENDNNNGNKHLQDDDTLTAVDFLAQQEALEKEAAEVLGDDPSLEKTSGSFKAQLDNDNDNDNGEGGGNTYGRNFDGIFCTCATKYDPEQEEDTMFICASCMEMYKRAQLDFLIEPQQEFEPAKDEDAGKSLLEIAQYLIYVMAMCWVGINAFNKLKDNLMAYLRRISEARTVITKQDIESFFQEQEQQQRNKRRRL
eukprot:jgi/Hompol1/5621/HPOL_004594-RA